MKFVELKEKIKQAIASHQPFAVYRLPGESDFHYESSDTDRLFFNEFNRPFSESKTLEHLAGMDLLSASTPKDAYIASISDVVKIYEHEDEGKTVISRIIAGYTDVNPMIDRIDAYFASNPDAFCLLALTPGARLMIMSSPELLLSIDGSSFKTISLAGTRKSGSTEPWDEKNVREQKMVTLHLRRVLDKLGIKPDFTSPRSLKSNNVEHLCTELSGVISSEISLGRFVDELQPTPAVCGLPKDVAINNIDRFESHRRGLYAGYTGVKIDEDRLRIYVNIRCAFIDVESGLFNVVTGSGITSMSSPEAEFVETEMKAQPLLSLLIGKEKIEKSSKT